MAIGAVVAFATATLVACSKDNPRASGSSGSSETPSGTLDRCATPNEGCACDEPDKVVDCGKVKYVSGDNVACEIGKRTCSAAKWGACVGEQYGGTTTAGLRIRSLKALALSDAGVTCTGTDFACDPFACFQLADTAPGVDAGPNFTFDGGLTPIPTGDGGTGVGEAPYQGTATGVTQCGGTNVGTDDTGVGVTCVPGGYDVCGQDFRCDKLTSKCIRNGGPGYYDSTLPAGTVDLTVGAPCGPSGSGPGNVPFCNRGNGDIPAGSTIAFYQQGSPTANAGCVAPTGTLLTTVTLANKMEKGQCVSTEIPNSTGNKAITGYITSGVTEASPQCANNSAGWKTDGTPGCAACTTCTSLTTIKGKVYDPSGYDPVPTGVSPADSVAAHLANNTPVAGVTVFQPSGTLTALSDGLVCDTCASLSSPALYAALTDGKGEFSMTVTPGKQVPIVVQSGRWRRTVTITATACGVNDFEATGKKGTFRLPRNVTDGYGGTAFLPKMAITTGNQEALECLLNKVGVSDDQFAKYTATGTQRVQLFRDNGLDISGTAPAPSNLFTGTIPSKFNAILSDCGSSSQALNDPSTAQKTALKNYVNSGGRYFGNHRAAENMINDASGFNTGADPTWLPQPASQGAAGVIKWTTPGGVGNSNKVKIFTGSASPPGATAAQAQLKTWMEAVGANGGFTNDFTVATNPTPGAQWTGNKATAWFGSNGSLSNTGCSGGGALDNSCQNKWDGTTYGTRRLLSASFRSGTGGIETTCGAVDGYGLVLFNEMHVAADRTTNATGTFPGTCKNNALSPEEKALEYQIFQLTACNPGSLPPIPSTPLPPSVPPAVAKYEAITFTRDFQAVCPLGTRVSWSYFYWSALVPTTDAGAGANIVFRATSGDADGGTLVSTPDPLKTVLIGTASTTATNAVFMAAAPYNTALGPVSVSSHFKIDPPTFAPPQPPIQNGDILRVFMTFNPDAAGSTAATLVDWKATYDCIDAE